MNIHDKVTKVIANQLHISQKAITSNARIDQDLGADSLDAIELVMKFEEEFNIEIPEHDLEHLTTVGSIVTYLTSRLQGDISIDSIHRGSHMRINKFGEIIGE